MTAAARIFTNSHIGMVQDGVAHPGSKHRAGKTRRGARSRSPPCSPRQPTGAVQRRNPPRFARSIVEVVVKPSAVTVTVALLVPLKVMVIVSAELSSASVTVAAMLPDFGHWLPLDDRGRTRLVIAVDTVMS